MSVAATRWYSFLAFIPSVGMVFMDQSILAVALPDIQKEFGSSSSLLIWSVNAYLLSITICFLLGGRLGTILGHRKAHLLGMAIFTFFSALCSLSPNVEFLSVARGFQGLGAGLMVPTQMALVASMFPPHVRGRISGLMTSFGMVFVILAPAIGGFLTQTLSWRWIFWINLPIAAIGMLLIVLMVPKTHSGKGTIDLLGFFYFAMFCALVTLVFMQGQEWGWDSKAILLCALFSPIFAYLLLKREKKVAHPLLDLALFKCKVFAAINVSVCITQFVFMITIFRTIYIENVLGYTPSQAGLIISITSLPVLFMAPLGGFLSDKVGPRLPVFMGYSCMILSFFWLGFASTPSLVPLLIVLTIFGIGIPLIFTPSYTTVMTSIEPEKLGTAVAMVSTLRSFASTMGLSLIFVFVNIEERIHLPKMGARLAEIYSFSAVHLVLGCLLIIAFITAITFHKRKSLHHLPSSPAEGWD